MLKQYTTEIFPFRTMLSLKCSEQSFHNLLYERKRRKFCHLVKILLSGKNLLYFLTKLQNSRLDLIEGTCKIEETQKIEVSSGMRRRHCGKRGKCWLPGFYPIHTKFSEALFIQVVKSWDFVIKARASYFSVTLIDL